jgi:hypothetical protein
MGSAAMKNNDSRHGREWEQPSAAAKANDISDDELDELPGGVTHEEPIFTILPYPYEIN